MLQPQSDEEIRPYIEELKRLDPLLDVRWNPESVMLTKGSYSELGKAIRPTYDGRWEVIRYQTASWRGDDRPFVVICTVTEFGREGGILFMIKGGAYAPIGDWLLELMRSADSANVEQFTKLREKIWAQHDAADRAHDEIDEGAMREALDHQAFRQNFAGGVGRYHGKGADFSGGSQSRLLIP